VDTWWTGNDRPGNRTACWLYCRHDDHCGHSRITSASIFKHSSDGRPDSDRDLALLGLIPHKIYHFRHVVFSSVSELSVSPNDEINNTKKSKTAEQTHDKTVELQYHRNLASIWFLTSSMQVHVNFDNKTAELSQRRPRDAPDIWVPWKFLRVLTTHTATFREICNGLLFQSILRMCVQNLKFVALPVPEIIGCTRKIWAVPAYAHAPFSPKILKGFCSDWPCEYTCQIWSS